MAVAKVNLKTLKDGTAQKLEFKFHFDNFNGSALSATELAKYRIVVHIWTDIPLDNTANFVTFLDETGWTKGSWYDGSMELQNIVSRHYDSSTHPACITSGHMFRHTVMARLKPVSMTNGMPDNNYIEGFSLGIRNTSWKNFLLDNSGNSVADQSYSMNGLTTSYADNSHIILEYNNGGDETNMDDSHWEVVQEYTNSTTQDSNTGVHPYTPGTQYYQNVNDHKYLIATAATWIDSADAGTAKGSGGSPDPLYAYGAWWNGSASTNRRVLLKFDMSVFGTNDTINDAKLIVVSDTTDVQWGQLDVVEISGSWTETAATWNNSNAYFSTQQSYRTARNTYEEKSAVVDFTLSTSYVSGQISGNNYGHGLKHNSETGSVTRGYEGRGVTGCVPALLVKYTPSSTTTRRVMIIS